MHLRSGKRLADCLFVAALMLFALAGMGRVSFHGDESTIIYMSRDWFTLAVDHNIATVYYNVSQPPTIDRELRVLNGVVSKYSIGLAFWLAGIEPSALNSPWNWGLGWWENQYYGAIPNEKLLFVARLSSIWLLSLSIAVVFAIGRRSGGRRLAWLAAFCYATLPAVLLNGRRAIFEGALLLSSALLVLAGLETLYRIQRNRKIGWLWLGLAAGFAIASKHTGLLMVIPTYGAILVMGWRRWRRTITAVAASGMVMIGAFLALNPAWWADPVSVAREVLRLRTELLTRQADSYGHYTQDIDRLRALFQQPLGPPQHFEVTTGWTEWIGEQVKAYDASGLAGLPWANLGALTLVILGAGIFAALTRRDGLALYLVALTGWLLVTLYLTNMLPWQRYYLPLCVTLAVLLGLGINEIWRRLAGLRFQKPRWEYAR